MVAIAILTIFTVQQNGIDSFSVLLHSTMLLDTVSLQNHPADFKACDGYLSLTKTYTTQLVKVWKVILLLQMTLSDGVNLSKS